MTKAIWLSEAEVVSLMHLGQAITALEAGFLMEARGEAQNMVKTHVSWGHNNLHAIGASFVGAGLVGTKTWAHTQGSACPLLILFDAQTGALKAIIECFALGQMRTAAISGVATRLLALPEASDMAIIGTGKQALAQVAAVAAVRPITRLQVYSRSVENRDAFIQKVREQFTFEVVNASSIQAAVAGAHVITLVTRATQAFLGEQIIAPHAHINAVGAITPEREEFFQDVFERCSVIAVDSLPSAQKLSKEMMTQFGHEPSGWERVQPLSTLLANDVRRRNSDDLTLFKAMGVGISDLSLGAALYERAVAQGIGRPITQPEKIKPRLTAN
ncbi:MAG: ornithine cyclodeaminase family protein [Candidimonas sp.]|nr:MAG: ornithine cyclodeaminase family protein [Candidimonas sp.]TAM20989.1 MAG: ornithine cyclodeaminase family protein [Candidimonas sp.]